MNTMTGRPSKTIYRGCNASPLTYYAGGGFVPGFQRPGSPPAPAVSLGEDFLLLVVFVPSFSPPPQSANNPTLSLSRTVA